MTVSYPPIDTSAYVHPDPAAVDAELARRGLRRDGYVLFLSRVSPEKGVDDLIDGFARSAARDHVELVVAGGPAEELLGTDPQARRLRALARRRGVADRVRFLGGVRRPDVPASRRSWLPRLTGVALAEAGREDGGVGGARGCARESFSRLGCSPAQRP